MLDKLVEDEIGRWKRRKKSSRVMSLLFPVKPAPAAVGSARILATDLNMNMYGSELIHQVAESAHMSDKVIKSLDEKSISFLDSMISSFFESRHIWPNEYMRHLSMVIHTNGDHGNIIIDWPGCQLYPG